MPDKLVNQLLDNTKKAMDNLFKYMKQKDNKICEKIKNIQVSDDLEKVIKNNLIKEEILDLLTKYKSEYENVIPDAILKDNYRKRMFELLDKLQY